MDYNLQILFIIDSIINIHYTGINNYITILLRIM